MIPVMEMMILDGVEERHHVREYIAAVIGDGADRDVFYVTWQRRGRIASAFATTGGECSLVNARTSPSPSVLRRLEGEGYRHGE